MREGEGDVLVGRRLRPLCSMPLLSKTISRANGALGLPLNLPRGRNQNPLILFRPEDAKSRGQRAWYLGKGGRDAFRMSVRAFSLTRGTTNGYVKVVSL